MDPQIRGDSESLQQKNQEQQQSPVEILSEPSGVIKHAETIINIDGAQYEIILITMGQSFLLVIKNFDVDRAPMPRIDDQVKDNKMSHEEIIKCYMNSNESLRGLCLAMGDHSTCLIESSNSLASATLASRLSTTLNMNRPVYVANNLQISHDILDSSGVTSRLYQKIFQFVRKNYEPLVKSETP